MKWLKNYCATHPQVAVSVPAILCAIQFIMTLCGVIRTGIVDTSVLGNLVSAADGFESVVLFVIMIAFNNKKN